tara:strand:- start:10866 stop:13589 length:2724 start_codon:yes stop_codon:yes gene_type:complete
MWSSQTNGYTRTEIELIMRDLSMSEKLDINILVDNYKKTHIKLSKKRQQIITLNIQDMSKKKIDADLERLRYFKNFKTLTPNILAEINNFTTEIGKTRMKLKILRIALRHNLHDYIVNMYLQIITNTEIKYTKKETSTIKKANLYMKQINYKRLQFEKLSNQLIPLDFYNTYTKKLDPWQLDTMAALRRGENVLVEAPTSCGKTWLGLYPALLNKKVLFIVPTEALVLQVGGLFSKFVSQPTLISHNLFYEGSGRITVATPGAMLDYLPKVKASFDIIIVDEIHNLNHTTLGPSYVNIIQMFSGIQLLALSATIREPHKVVLWLEGVGYTPVKLISYTVRFINLQRHLFIHNELITLNPLSCLHIDDINNEFLNKNIPFTPVDCISLYDELAAIFPKEMSSLHIAQVFSEENKRLSLDNAREYEGLLKKKLVECKDIDPLRVEQLLHKFYIDTSLNDKEVNLYNLFNELKNNNKIPCIVFQENPANCVEIFKKLISYLEKLESLNYPYYYENLQYKQSQYKRFLLDMERFKESLETTKATTRITLADKIKKYRDTLDKSFQSSYINRLVNQLRLIHNSDHSDKIKTVQTINIETEITSVRLNCSLKYIDIFKKHPEFSLNQKGPMSEEAIRDIKRTIKKKLDIDMSYTNFFMQGLKRGIGIYTKELPFAYNLIVQKLAQNGDLGFVIADDRLAMGINMPFRSSCILGYGDNVHFEHSNYMQMIGRAGRRGMDKEGHIIFANVNWKALMKSSLPVIEIKDCPIPNMGYLNSFSTLFATQIRTFHTGDSVVKDMASPVKHTIMWGLRHHPGAFTFCNNLDTILTISEHHYTAALIQLLGNYFIIHKSVLESFKINNIMPHNVLYINEFVDLLSKIYSGLLLDKKKYSVQLNYISNTIAFYKKNLLKNFN